MEYSFARRITDSMLKHYLSSLLAVKATDAPDAASVFAIAAPMPLEAPVTKATLPDSTFFSRW